MDATQITTDRTRLLAFRGFGAQSEKQSTSGRELRIRRATILRMEKQALGSQCLRDRRAKFFPDPC